MYKLMSRGAVSSRTVESTVTRLRRAVAIFMLLGLTWLFGLLSLIPGSSLVFQYLFGIFNSLQGFFIFVFFCLVPVEVRKVLKGIICCHIFNKCSRTQSENFSSKFEIGGETGAKGLSDDFKSNSPTGDTPYSSGFTNPLRVPDAIEMIQSAKTDNQEPSQQSTAGENPIDQDTRQPSSDHEPELSGSVPTTLHNEVEEPTKSKVLELK